MQDVGVQTHQMQHDTQQVRTSARKRSLPCAKTDEVSTPANLFPLVAESQDDTHTIEEATAANTKTLLQLPSAAEIEQYEVAYLKFKCASGPNDHFYFS